MKNMRIESLVIAAGIALSGCFVCNGIKSIARRDRAVSVRGLAEKEVKADRVIWPIVYKTVGSDLQAVYANLSNADGKIQAFLKKNGVADGEISIGAPEVNDLWTIEYNDNRQRERYNAKTVVTVTSSDVDKVRSLILRTGELLAEGIAIAPADYQTKVQYTFTSLNRIKPQMIEEATRNAREAAEKFSKDSGSGLGKIKSASQGLFSIEDRDGNTPFIKNVRVVTMIDYYLDN